MRISRREAMVLLAAPAVGGADPGSVNAGNIADFDFITGKIEENYAGFDLKTAADRAGYLAHTARWRSRAAICPPDELFGVLKGWIGYFKDLHTQVFTRSDAADDHQPVQAALTWNESFVRDAIDGLGSRRDRLESIWRIGGDRYRVGILRTGLAADEFAAVVLATTVASWRPGQVKAEFRRRPGGGYDALVRFGDHASQRLTATLRLEGAILDLGVAGGAPWVRDWPSPADPSAVERLVPPESFFLRRLSERTVWMRLPNFSDSSEEVVRSLVSTYLKESTASPNLVLDLRRNGGGSDYVYRSLSPLLYTQPIYVIGAELRATADNIALREAIALSLESTAPEQASELRRLNARMQAHLGGYVQQNDRPFSIQRFERVLPYPKRVAVMLDLTGSTGEQFLLEARQSHKVTTFGQSNSAGVLDFANVVSMSTPSGRFTVQWAISRSMRLPEDPVDPDGIAPEMAIPAEERDPVAFAQAWLERQSD